MEPPTPVIKGLGEIGLRVNDLKSMERFYSDVIGLEVMKRFEGTTCFRIADGSAGHPQVLALFDRSQSVRGPRIHHQPPDGVSSERSTLDHLAFGMDITDYEREKKRLESLGLAVEAAQLAWVRWRSLYGADPKGNTVEFVCADPSLKDQISRFVPRAGVCIPPPVDPVRICLDAGCFRDGTRIARPSTITYRAASLHKICTKLGAHHGT